MRVVSLVVHGKCLCELILYLYCWHNIEWPFCYFNEITVRLYVVPHSVSMYLRRLCNEFLNFKDHTVDYANMLARAQDIE